MQHLNRLDQNLTPVAAPPRIAQSRFLSLLIILGLAATCGAQTLTDQVVNCANQLRAIVPVADEFKDQREQVLSSLNDLEAAARDGHQYLALYRLQSLWTSIQPVEYSRSKAAVAKEGLPAFEKSWRQLSTELKSQQASINKAIPPMLPTAVRGLIQICLTKSQAYYESSRPFGEDVQLRSGLYYMGVASAELDFASLCLRQSFSGQPSSPPFHSLGPELLRLDNSIVELYKQRDAPELVEEFIALSSNMELANQLERAARYDGALIAYLDTILKLGLLEVPAPSPEAAATLGTRLDQMANRLGDGNRDNSVGMIYLAMARQALARTTAGPQASDNLKKAAVVIDRVLPAYSNTVLEVK